MESVQQPTGEFIAPEESERWILWVSLYGHYHRDKRYQQIVQQDLLPLAREVQRLNPAFGNPVVDDTGDLDWRRLVDLASSAPLEPDFEWADAVTKAVDAFFDALATTTRDVLRLTWQGQPLKNAVQSLYADVARAALPLNHPDREMIRFTNDPRPTTDPVFTLRIEPTRISVEAPGIDPVQYTLWGRNGFGYGAAEWSALEDRAIQELREGIRLVREAFESAYDGPRRRPSSVQADRESMTALFNWLFHRRVPPNLSGACGWRRVSQMATRLGIDMPPKESH